MTHFLLVASVTSPTGISRRDFCRQYEMLETPPFPTLFHVPGTFSEYRIDLPRVIKTALGIGESDTIGHLMTGASSSDLIQRVTELEPVDGLVIIPFLSGELAMSYPSDATILYGFSYGRDVTFGWKGKQLQLDIHWKNKEQV